jgi:hypothetical protein
MSEQRSIVNKVINSLLLACIITSSLGLFAAGPGTVSAATVYAKSLRITIDQTKIDSTLTDFPLLIKLTTGSPVLSELTQANRKRMSITQGTQELYVEIESWSTTQAILWVKVPTISATVNTVLTLYYDRSHAENTAYVGDTLDSTTPKVWSNGYVSVFHLSGNAYDSASARNNGQVGSGVTFVSGLVGVGAQFTGSNRITVPDDYYYSPVNNGGIICVEFQIKPLEDSYSSWRSPVGKMGSGTEEYKFNIYGRSETSGPRRFYVFSPDGHYGSGANVSPTTGQSVTRAGTWYKLQGQTFAGMVALYEGAGTPGRGTRGTGGDVGVNKGWNLYGLGQGCPSGAVKMKDTGSSFGIGASPGQPGLKSIIDEVRISKVNRSMAWMKADSFSELGQLVSFS